MLLVTTFPDTHQHFLSCSQSTRAWLAPFSPNNNQETMTHRYNWLLKHTSGAAPCTMTHKEREKKGRQRCSYTGSRLHGVAQVAAEVAGLVLRLVAAGQLGQALGSRRTNPSETRHSADRPKKVLIGFPAGLCVFCSGSSPHYCGRCRCSRLRGEEPRRARPRTHLPLLRSWR